VENLIGSRIQTFRERLDMSQVELATSSGIDVALITAIEDGKVTPALGILVKISRSLGQRLGTFMDDQVSEDPHIVRYADRRQNLAHHKENAEQYSYYPLAAGKTDRHMEPFFVEIAPGHTKQFSSHEGEEFMVVIAGQVELTYGNKTCLLTAGDSMYYNSIVPHHVGCVGDTTAQLYAVVYMPY
jgi:transcriptional regulator with XRE-family HTH domain